MDVKRIIYQSYELSTTDACRITAIIPKTFHKIISTNNVASNGTARLRLGSKYPDVKIQLYESHQLDQTFGCECTDRCAESENGQQRNEDDCFSATVRPTDARNVTNNKYSDHDNKG